MLASVPAVSSAELLVFPSITALPRAFVRPGKCNKYQKFPLELRGDFCELKKGLDKGLVNILIIVFQNRSQTRESMRIFINPAWFWQWEYSGELMHSDGVPIFT